MPIAPINWRETVERLVPGWLQREWGGKFTQFIGLYQDFSAVATGEALRASWILEDTSPDDALSKTGFDRGFPRYPYESDDQYRARQATCWAMWERAGSESVLLTQLAALGITAEIYTDDEWPRPPTPWKSKFIVLVTDDVFGPPVRFGDAGVAFGPAEDFGGGMSGGHLFGLDGDINLIAAMRGILKTFKRGTEICPEVVVLDGIVFGGGETFGDGSVFGGENLTISMV